MTEGKLAKKENQHTAITGNAPLSSLLLTEQKVLSFQRTSINMTFCRKLGANVAMSLKYHPILLVQKEICHPCDKT